MTTTDKTIRVTYAAFDPQMRAHGDIRDSFHALVATLSNEGEAVAASLVPLHGALYSQSLAPRTRPLSLLCAAP
jgi:hypothetical protein